MQDERGRKQKRKLTKRGTLNDKAQVLKAMNPAPLPLQPAMTFVDQSCSGLHRLSDAAALIEEDVMARLEDGSMRLRIGRLGRVLLDQVDESTMMQLGAADNTETVAGREVTREGGGDDLGRIEGSDGWKVPCVAKVVGERLRRLMEM